MKILVCGGRDYSNVTMMARTMMPYLNPELEIISGAAPGADTLASKWARQNRVVLHEYPAQWELYKKAAGSIRNQRMLDEGKPDLVIAFPGGPGTAHMVRIATKAGVPIEHAGAAR